MAIDPKVKTKNDLIKEVARKSGITQSYCREVFDCIFDEIKIELEYQNTVLIQNFAKFEIKPDNRKFFNPKTREPVENKSTRIAVTMSPALRDKILK